MGDYLSNLPKDLTVFVCIIVAVCSYVILYFVRNHRFPALEGVFLVVAESAAFAGFLRVNLKLLAGGFANVLSLDEKLCLLAGTLISMYVLIVKIFEEFAGIYRPARKP